VKLPGRKFQPECVFVQCYMASGRSCVCFVLGQEAAGQSGKTRPPRVSRLFVWGFRVLFLSFWSVFQMSCSVHIVVPQHGMLGVTANSIAPIDSVCSALLASHALSYHSWVMLHD